MKKSNKKNQELSKAISRPTGVLSKPQLNKNVHPKLVTPCYNFGGKFYTLLKVSLTAVRYYAYGYQFWMHQVSVHGRSSGARTGGSAIAYANTFAANNRQI